MNTCPNQDKAIAIEDAFMAFVLACRMEQKNPNEENVKFMIEKDARDTLTDQPFQLIISGHAGPIDEFSILYAYDSDDIIFEIRFFKQENEMAEFIGHWTGRLRKSRIYRLRFDNAEDFIYFFNELRAKSMKDGSSYAEWRNEIAN